VETAAKWCEEPGETAHHFNRLHQTAIGGYGGEFQSSLLRTFPSGAGRAQRGRGEADRAPPDLIPVAAVSTSSCAAGGRQGGVVARLARGGRTAPAHAADSPGRFSVAPARRMESAARDRGVAG
jgi:hypothetical protein